MAATSTDQAVGRRRLLRGLAGAGTVGIASVLATRPVAAQDAPQHLVLGETNRTNAETRIEMDPESPTSGGLVVEAMGDGSGMDSFPFAVGAYSHTGTGLWARSDTGLAAIHAEAAESYAIMAENTSAGVPAVAASSFGRAAGLGAWSRDGAQLLLQPEPGRVGPPSGYFPTGSVLLDSVGDLYVKTTEETSGWVRLVREDQVPAAETAGRTVALSSPARVLDEPMRAGTSKVVVMAPAATGIPANATAVLGSISAFRAGYQGRLLVSPADASTSAVAASFTQGMPAAAGFTCGVDPRSGGAAFTVHASGTGTATVHARVDITAYVT
jgi:hypothetical protein